MAAAENENLALKEQIRATDEFLQQAREKVRAVKLKLMEADHYRALVHELRSRRYLRPFIPRVGFNLRKRFS